MDSLQIDSLFGKPDWTSALDSAEMKLKWNLNHLGVNAFLFLVYTFQVLMKYSIRFLNAVTMLFVKVSKYLFSLLGGAVFRDHS